MKELLQKVAKLELEKELENQKIAKLELENQKIANKSKQKQKISHLGNIFLIVDFIAYKGLLPKEL